MQRDGYQPSQSSGNERFLKVSYNELLKATDGFSIANLIGEGGFNSVYKGILDCDDDKFVAVKIITTCSSVDFQGNDFKALVYEFMPNGSVHDWLHSSANTSKLNLLQRINILRDVATALDYLHNRCQTTIVHGDLKPSNILLDADMVAHVGDFSLARLLGTDLNQNSSTGVKGTIGYAPPEYGIGSEMTSSGDVYIFGILLLEVMTGKKPTDDMFNEGLSIHKFASMALPDHVTDVIDDDAIVLQSTEVNAKKVEECLVAIIKIGVSCSVDSPPQRMTTEIVVIELQSLIPSLLGEVETSEDFYTSSSIDAIIEETYGLGTLNDPSTRFALKMRSKKIGGHGRNQVGQYAGQIAGNQNGYNTVQNVRNWVVQNPVQNPGHGLRAMQIGIMKIRYYNCQGIGYLARNRTIRPRRMDAAYLQTQLLTTQKEESGIQLQAEEFNLIDVA
ncbi:kinase-like domain-containing protein [Tanacetum coccineum]